MELEAIKLICDCVTTCTAIISVICLFICIVHEGVSIAKESTRPSVLEQIFGRKED